MVFETKSRKAMSLGEVLITLGIIGLVAAITIPLLVVIIPNKNETLTKKGKYILERTVSDIVNNDDYYPVKVVVTTNAAGEEVNTKVYGLQNTDAIVENGIKYEGASKLCKLAASKFTLAPDSPVNCDDADADFSFISSDGIHWKFPVSDFKSGDQEIRFQTVDRGKNDCYVTASANTCKDPNILTYKITSQGNLYAYKPTSKWIVTPGAWSGSTWNHVGNGSQIGTGGTHLNPGSQGGFVGVGVGDSIPRN